MKIVFIGSGEIGVPALKAVAADYPIVGVFTRPDRPAGRGLKLHPMPIKEEAGKLGLKIHQPESINSEESLKLLKELGPDLIAVAAYGQILSRAVLKVPRIGAVNLHASLLPKYRGAAPINWAIINGETETGITTFLMDEKMDTGDVLLQRRIPIGEEDTAGSLHDKLAKLGAEVMVETLKGLEQGTLKSVPQDHSRASFAPKLKKEDGRIDWRKSSRNLFNLIRGTNPFPGAFTFFHKLRLKVHHSRIIRNDYEGVPGEVVDFGEEGPIIKTGDGTVELVEVQPEAKAKMGGMDFVHGYRVEVGNRLNS